MNSIDAACAGCTGCEPSLCHQGCGGGNEPTGEARERFNVKFYLVAILFIVFDIEAVFIYPWAVVFSESAKGQGGISPLLVLVELLAFVAIILVGLTYAWRKGALEWGGKASS